MILLKLFAKNVEGGTQVEGGIPFMITRQRRR